MKYLILSTIFLTSLLNAATIKHLVVDRDKNDKLVEVEKTLIDLNSSKEFDGKFFKVVEGSGNMPVKVDDSLLSKKAANVYFHLTKAKDFFASIGVKQKEKIVIRVDIVNKFHKTYHFQNPKLEPQFNNATTINSGEGVDVYGIPAWGNEIWFRPAKRIKASKEFNKRFRTMVRRSIPSTLAINADTFLYTTLNAVISDDIEGSIKTSAETILQNYLASSLLRFAVPELMLLFMDKGFFLDTAFIPEVAYHEYTHYAMSDYVPPVVNNTVMEGFADFYAAKISGRKEIAHKLGNYANLVGSRKVDANSLYEMKLDTGKGMGGDFVISLFFEMDEMIEREEGKFVSLKKLFDLRKQITVDTKIGSDFSDIFWEGLPNYRLEATMILHNRGI